MKIFLSLLICLSLSSCDKASDFMYNNFSLQKNIDMAEENHRKNIEGDFKIDGYSYTFPSQVHSFAQNGFTYKIKKEGQDFTEDIQNLDVGEVCDIYFSKDQASFFGQVTNNTGTSADIGELSLSYIKITKDGLGTMDFSLDEIKMNDDIRQIENKLSDKEIISLNNDQYYMYLNGQYVVIFTMKDDKLVQIEIIPNERLADYEKN